MARRRHRRLRTRFDGSQSFHRTPQSLALLALTLTLGCTRASVPIDVNQASPFPRPQVEAESEGTPAPIDRNSDDYAVVWIPEGETLIVRELAGISSPEVARLGSGQRSIELTGSSSSLGSSQWVEIRTLKGATGWVPRWNLTEQVEADTFCADPEVDRLIEEFKDVLRSKDGRALADLATPLRGLIVRVDAWNPEIRMPSNDLLGAFVDPTEIEWGSRYASQTAIRGSFADVVGASLSEVFLGEYELACDRILTGRSAEPAQWPSEYQNLNHLSFHRPAPAGGNIYGWRTWVVGIEYQDGEPRIVLLMQFRPHV